MTVTSSNRKSGPYEGNGATTVWPYTFKLTDASHLKLVHTSVAGIETLLTLNTDYTVDGIGNAGGGNVYYPVSGDPLPSGEKITPYREVPQTQDSDFTNSGDYIGENHERALDELQMQIQDVTEEVSRSLKVDISSTDDPANMLDTITQSVAETSNNAAAAQQAATNASDSADAAETAKTEAQAAAAILDPSSYRQTSDQIVTADIADNAVTAAKIPDAAITQEKIDPNVELGGGGPSIGIARINDPNIRTDLTVEDLTLSFTADAAANTLSRGTDDKYENGFYVQFRTDGTLPAPLVAGTTYYVVGITTATMQVSDTYNGAAIDLTDAGTGNHTVFKCVNAMLVGPIAVEDGVTLTISSGCTLSIV